MHPTVRYRPRWYHFKKYYTYLNYLLAYAKNFDTRSIGASFRFTLFNKLPEEDYITSSEMGKFLVRKNTNDFQFINFTYKSAIKKYIERNINEFEVFIDAGACIGEYDIWLAGLGKRCMAFEPVHFKAIERNIILNRPVSRNIDLYPLALGSAVGKDILHNRAPDACMDTIDNMIKDKKIILFSTESVLMKIDVGTCGTEVIKGAREFIKNARNLAIIYEHFPEDQGMTEKTLAAVADFIFTDIDAVNRLAVKNLKLK